MPAYDHYAMNQNPPVEQPTPRPRSRRVVFITLIVLLLVVLALVLLVFWHFLIVLALATGMALLLRGVHIRLTRVLRGYNGLSAFSLVLVVALIILIPVMGLLAAIATQALNLYDWLAPQLNTASLDEWWRQHLLPRFPWLEQAREMGEGRVLDFLTAAASRLAGAANNLLQGAVAGMTSAAFEVALLLIALFFFLRDGAQFREGIRRVSPLTKAQADDVLDSVAKTMRGALASLLFVPMVQGVLATVGYFVIGLPNALLWGGFTTLLAFVPAIGTPLVWVPICIYLFANGQVWQGVVLALYCGLIVSTIDNFLRPLFLRGAARIHPLWSFLAILGGVMTFGALGLLVGPLILSLGVSALRIYEMDVLRPAPPVAPPAAASRVKSEG
jgi:predicted PurR-regulated permease PerM